MKQNLSHKKILVAPLNWGLGHASRCIPIINALLENNFVPVIASDGSALQLLRKEFPALSFYRLPSYHITYPKKSSYLKLRLLRKIPLISSAVHREKRLCESIVQDEKITGVISDNRFGFRSSKVPSVYITHQINVLSGSTTRFTSFIHKKIISKFDVCWVPDYDSKNSLGGKLSTINPLKSNFKFIGALSRFSYQDAKKKYDLLVLLSGPEPQRSIFENKLLKELKSYNKKVLFVRGIIDGQQRSVNKGKIKMINFMLTQELQKSINESKIVLTRSGYSTIMDLDKLNARAFFVPTPGQSEQEYLAEHLEEQKIAPFASQKDFKVEILEKINQYKGFSKSPLTKTLELGDLFNSYF